MVRDHLSERLSEAGGQLLSKTDALGLEAQGAMWVYSHALEDWRFYLVTSLVDTIGRKKTYRLLLECFSHLKLPQEMTIEDVHLGSPHEQFFKMVSGAIMVDGGRAFVNDCYINGISFDGVIYRSVRPIPSEQEAKRIERQFTKRVKELAKHACKATQHKERV